MKHITTTLILQFLIPILAGCASTADVSPSKNEKLQKVTPSKKCNKSHNCDKKGYMQRSLDKWLKEEWTPTVEKDEIVRKKYMKEDISDKNKKVFIEKEERAFTLQEYADKASAYIKAHPSDYNNSHLKKVDSLPVIGK